MYTRRMVATLSPSNKTEPEASASAWVLEETGGRRPPYETAATRSVTPTPAKSKHPARPTALEGGITSAADTHGSQRRLRSAALEVPRSAHRPERLRNPGNSHGDSYTNRGRVMPQYECSKTPPTPWHTIVFNH